VALRSAGLGCDLTVGPWKEALAAIHEYAPRWDRLFRARPGSLAAYAVFNCTPETDAVNHPQCGLSWPSFGRETLEHALRSEAFVKDRIVSGDPSDAPMTALVTDPWEWYLANVLFSPPDPPSALNAIHDHSLARQRPASAALDGSTASSGLGDLSASAVAAMYPQGAWSRALPVQTLRGYVDTHATTAMGLFLLGVCLPTLACLFSLARTQWVWEYLLCRLGCQLCGGKKCTEPGGACRGGWVLLGRGVPTFNAQSSWLRRGFIDRKPPFVRGAGNADDDDDGAPEGDAEERIAQTLAEASAGYDEHGKPLRAKPPTPSPGALKKPRFHYRRWVRRFVALGLVLYAGVVVCLVAFSHVWGNLALAPAFQQLALSLDRAANEVQVGLEPVARELVLAAATSSLQKVVRGTLAAISGAPTNASVGDLASLRPSGVQLYDRLVGGELPVAPRLISSAGHPAVTNVSGSLGIDVVELERAVSCVRGHVPGNKSASDAVRLSAGLVIGRLDATVDAAAALAGRLLPRPLTAWKEISQTFRVSASTLSSSSASVASAAGHLAAFVKAAGLWTAQLSNDTARLMGFRDTLTNAVNSATSAFVSLSNTIAYMEGAGKGVTSISGLAGLDATRTAVSAYNARPTSTEAEYLASSMESISSGSWDTQSDSSLRSTLLTRLNTAIQALSNNVPEGRVLGDLLYRWSRRLEVVRQQTAPENVLTQTQTFLQASAFSTPTMPSLRTAANTTRALVQAVQVAATVLVARVTGEQNPVVSLQRDLLPTAATLAASLSTIQTVAAAAAQWTNPNDLSLVVPIVRLPPVDTLAGTSVLERIRSFPSLTTLHLEDLRTQNLTRLQDCAEGVVDAYSVLNASVAPEPASITKLRVLIEGLTAARPNATDFLSQTRQAIDRWFQEGQTGQLPLLYKLSNTTSRILDSHSGTALGLMSTYLPFSRYIPPGSILSCLQEASSNSSVFRNASVPLPTALACRALTTSEVSAGLQATGTSTSDSIIALPMHTSFYNELFTQLSTAESRRVTASNLGVARSTAQTLVTALANPDIWLNATITNVSLASGFDSLVSQVIPALQTAYDAVSAFHADKRCTHDGNTCPAVNQACAAGLGFCETGIRTCLREVGGLPAQTGGGRRVECFSHQDCRTTFPEFPSAVCNLHVPSITPAVGLVRQYGQDTGPDLTLTANGLVSLRAAVDAVLTDSPSRRVSEIQAMNSSMHSIRLSRVRDATNWTAALLQEGSFEGGCSPTVDFQPFYSYPNYCTDALGLGAANATSRALQRADSAVPWDLSYSALYKLNQSTHNLEWPFNGHPLINDAVSSSTSLHKYVTDTAWRDLSDLTTEANLRSLYNATVSKGASGVEALLDRMVLVLEHLLQAGADVFLQPRGSISVHPAKMFDFHRRFVQVATTPGFAKQHGGFHFFALLLQTLAPGERVQEINIAGDILFRYFSRLKAIAVESFNVKRPDTATIWRDGPIVRSGTDAAITSLQEDELLRLWPDDRMCLTRRCLLNTIHHLSSGQVSVVFPQAQASTLGMRRDTLLFLPLLVPLAVALVALLPVVAYLRTGYCGRRSFHRWTMWCSACASCGCAGVILVALSFGPIAALVTLSDVCLSPVNPIYTLAEGESRHICFAAMNGTQRFASSQTGEPLDGGGLCTLQVGDAIAVADWPRTILAAGTSCTAPLPPRPSVDPWLMSLAGGANHMDGNVLFRAMLQSATAPIAQRVRQYSTVELIEPLQSTNWSMPERARATVFGATEGIASAVVNTTVSRVREVLRCSNASALVQEVHSALCGPIGTSFAWLVLPWLGMALVMLLAGWPLSMLGYKRLPAVLWGYELDEAVNPALQRTQMSSDGTSSKFVKEVVTPADLEQAMAAAGQETAVPTVKNTANGLQTVWDTPIESGAYVGDGSSNNKRESSQTMHTPLSAPDMESSLSEGLATVTHVDVTMTPLLSGTLRGGRSPKALLPREQDWQKDSASKQAAMELLGVA
jgi:hypothetical protein